VTDPGNSDTSFKRSAVRNRVVPELQAQFGEFSSALIRAAHLREQDGRYCDGVARDIYGQHADIDGESTRLPRDMIRDSDPAISLRVLRLAAISRIGDTDVRELTHERVAAVLKATSGRTGATIELPYGVCVSIERDLIAFR
jgi:hypothetical protein